MSRNRQAAAEEAPKVPGYIVTFSDMVTLLLTFFVLLLTLAEVQDPELFNKGRDSFIESVRMLGLGMLPGKKQRPDFGYVKNRYFISEPQEALVVRTIDAKEEEVRRIFNKLTESAKAMPSAIAAKVVDFSVTEIHFAPGQARLDEQGRNFLTDFCQNLQSSPRTGRSKLYVLGLAPEQAPRKEQYVVSARRAHAVADVLASNLQWPVYSWGAGPGGAWAGADGSASDKTHILIAVLRGGD